MNLPGGRLVVFFLYMVLSGCDQEQQTEGDKIIIGEGKMPEAAIDNHGNAYVVYGSGDSILCSISDDKGKSFTTPALVAVLPGLAASHMRGPQISTTNDGAVVMACNQSGDIFAYKEEEPGKWIPSARINDADTVAKEGLMALGSDHQQLFAVWLDMRDKHNKVYGAASKDGGKTWEPNKLVYASPDTTVCECCKPSVAVKEGNVYVMFRNWLNGNRDLYLIHSVDTGNTFGMAKKLGTESWALDGCPMDGGALVIKKNDSVETVWRRKNKIFTCQPGKPEMEIGEGRSVTMTAVNDKNIYAWIENGEVVVMKPGNKKLILGKGSMPVIRPIDKNYAICIWENKSSIYTTRVAL